MYAKDAFAISAPEPHFSTFMLLDSVRLEVDGITLSIMIGAALEILSMTDGKGPATAALKECVQELTVRLAKAEPRLAELI